MRNSFAVRFQLQTERSAKRRLSKGSAVEERKRYLPSGMAGGLYETSSSSSAAFVRSDFTVSFDADGRIGGTYGSSQDETLVPGGSALGQGLYQKERHARARVLQITD